MLLNPALVSESSKREHGEAKQTEAVRHGIFYAVQWTTMIEFACCARRRCAVHD